VKWGKGEMILNFIYPKSHFSCATSYLQVERFVTLYFGRAMRAAASARRGEGLLMTAISFSCAEVTTIHRHGFWLQCGEEELYLPFVEFPLFEYATVAQICHIECVTSNRLYWPALELDLSLDVIRNPMTLAYNGLGYDC
jgi:hypothetical protein